MNKCVVFMRVSRDSQTTAAQEEGIQKFLATVDEPYTMLCETATGKTTKTAVRQKLIEGIRRGQVKKVIVYRLDRLGRSVREVSAAIGEMVDRGCQLISVKDNIDVTTITGRLVANILLAVAEMERELIVERTRDGLAAARAKGVLTDGRRIAGYRWISKKAKKLLPMIRTLQRDGYGPWAIAGTVNLDYRTVKHIFDTPDKDLWTKKQCEDHARMMRERDNRKKDKE